ncbi:MAG: hypothetical protein H6741_33600 [Alphaproteobacteria bacterium]|nr:hypothetical protein [Alphaproteobacteria bacterium]
MVASLLATADALRDAGRWSSVAAVARLLEARAPRAAGRPEVAALLAEARTLRRDLQRPAGEIAPLLEGLRRAHPSPHAAEDVRALDVDADGRAELLLGHAGEVWTLHTTDTLDLPELDGPYAFKEDSVRPIQGGQVYIKDGERVVVRFTRQGRGDTRPWPLPSDDVAALDLDGDGAPEWVAVGQGGAVLAVDPGSLSARALRPPSTGSTLNNVEAIDLDEDGEAELVVTAGEWNAFDVRVLARDPEGPYPFRLRARSKLGYLRDAVSVRGGPRPRVALNKADVWGSRVVFPPESPRGAAPGLYTLAWDGEALDVAPLLLGDLACEELYSGDIDGDGRDDLAAECAEGALLFRQLPDGGFARAALLGVAIRALVDVDGDGDAEVLATLAEDERLWILGAGEQTLPAVEPSAPSPSASDPAIQRAEELAELGLVEQAVTQLRRLAVVQPALRGDASLRAARRSSLDQSVG